MQSIYILLLSLFLSIVLIPPLAKLAAPLGLTDLPGGRKIHSRAIPRTGGIAIAAGTLIPIWILVPLNQEVATFIAGSAVLLVFGLLDDRLNLDYRIKLLGQALAAVIVVEGANVSIQEIPFLGISGLPHGLSTPLTVFLLVGITNAVNLSDGLDGLAGGISVLALGCLATFSYQNGDPTSFSVAVAMMGATFGFLRYNSNPAQVFMGDSGSQFLGFGTGVLALTITQRPDTALGPLAPLLILGLPILDTLSVMVRRIASGRSPFSADKLHLHHQLLRAGLSQAQAVALVYLAQLIAVGLAYALRYSSDIAVLGTYLVFCASVLYGVHALIRRHEGTRERTETASAKARPKILAALEAKSDSILRQSYRGLQIMLPAMLIGGSTIATGASTDIVLLAAVLFVLALASPFLPIRLRGASERITLYATSLMVIFLASPAFSELLGTNAMAALFGALALLTGTWIRAAESEFRASSLDVLILILAIALPFLSDALAQRIAFLVLQSVIVFYAIEILLTQAMGRWSPIRLAALASLLTIVIKGLTEQWSGA